MPAPPATPVGVPTAGTLHAHAAPAPPPARAVPTPVVGPGVPPAPPAQVQPAVPYGGMQHVSRGPARNPHPGASRGTSLVATGGVPPAGPPPTVPPTLPAEVHPAPQAPRAPMPQAEPLGARHTEAQQSRPTEMTRARAATEPRGRRHALWLLGRHYRNRWHQCPQPNRQGPLQRLWRREHR